MAKILSYILFLISVISIHGQVNLRAFSDTRDLRTDQQLKVTIILEIRGNEDAQQSNLKFPDFSKFEMIGSASKRNTYLNLETQKVDNQFVYQVVLEPKQTGKIKIGSFLITANDKIYKTEPFDVYVTEGPKKVVERPNIADEMYLDLEVKDRNIYKNQPTIAVLRAYSKNFDNFRNIRHIKFPKNSEVKFHPISYEKSDIEQNDNSKISSQVIGIFLISTPDSGEIDIPPVSAMVKNSSSSATLKSKKVILNVKKLPENSPDNFKNAIGNFKLDLNCNAAENNAVGKPVEVQVKISGEGNFRSMDLPELLESENYSFFPPKISYDTKSSDKGFVGNVILNYVVIPKISGKIVLKTKDFSFFDPGKTAYENIKADTLSFVAMTADQIDDTKTTLDKVNDYTIHVLSNVNAPKLISDQLKIPKTHDINYKIIFGNLILLCGIVAVIFSYKSKKRKKIKKKKFSDKKIESIREVEERLAKEKPFDFEEEFSYLETLKNAKDFEGFFKAFENFQKELEIFSERQYNLPFTKYLIQTKGAKIAEDFRNLNQAISIEKFAPIKDEVHMDNLCENLKILISEIK